MGANDTWPNAIIGAVVTLVTSFTVVSPLLGGAVAGYLNEGDGPKVGALSGAIALLPFAVLFLLFATFVPFMAGMGGGMAFGIVGLLFGVFAFGFLAVWVVGLSALGGYLGVYLLDEDVL